MDAIVIIFFTSVVWLIISVALCIKAYGNGMIKGAHIHSHYLKQQAQEQRDAMLSEKIKGAKNVLHPN